jgi:hypothetical protein
MWTQSANQVPSTYRLPKQAPRLSKPTAIKVDLAQGSHVMRSPTVLSAKLFCGAFIFAISVSMLSASALAQVYQTQPNGASIYTPPLVSPIIQPSAAAPQIYPGQIINGERVIGTSVPATVLSRPEAVNPPLPPVTSSNPEEKAPPQSGQRPDKIPKTNFPIPTGPTLQSEPMATDAAINQTLQTSESSIGIEEKSDPLSQNTPPVGSPSLELPAEDPSAAPPTIDEDIMAEIKQIRAQLGGGISETLKDVDSMPSFSSIEITSPESSTETKNETKATPEELFSEELRSVMSEQQINGRADIQPPQAPVTNVADRAEQLRTCARELEQIAGRLENIEAYQHADQLRQQAAELWTSARQRQ